MGNPKKAKCVKYVLYLNTGYRKGIAFTLQKSVLKYPVQLIQMQREMVWVFDVQVVNYSIKFFFAS